MVQENARESRHKEQKTERYTQPLMHSLPYLFHLVRTTFTTRATATTAIIIGKN